MFNKPTLKQLRHSLIWALCLPVLAQAHNMGNSAHTPLPPVPDSIEQAKGTDAKLEHNKQLVVFAFNEAFNKHDLSALDQFFGPYKQHSAGADGVEGLRAFAVPFLKQFPNSSAEIKRVMAEGDWVMLHNHAKISPEDRGMICMDLFRVDGEHIVEHWDSCQEIPATRQNDNSPF